MVVIVCYLGLSNIALAGVSWPMFATTNVALALLNPGWRVKTLVRLYVVIVVVCLDKMEDDGGETNTMEAPNFREEPGRHCGAVLVNQTIDGRTLDGSFGHVNMDKTSPNHTVYAVMSVKRKKDNGSAFKSFFSSFVHLLGRRKTTRVLFVSLIVGLMLWD